MFVEAVRRCRYCKRDMTTTGSADSYQQNPYCSECLRERLEKANNSLVPTKWIQNGHYISLAPKSEIENADI